MSKTLWHLHVGTDPDRAKEVKIYVATDRTTVYTQGSWTDWGEKRKDGEAQHMIVESTDFATLITIGNRLYEAGLLIVEPMATYDAGYWFITTREDWSEVLIRGANDGEDGIEIRPGAWS